jgi:hypothetical protein
VRHPPSAPRRDDYVRSLLRVPREGPVAHGIGPHPIAARSCFEPLVKLDARTSLERPPKQFFGILLAPDAPVKIGRKEYQALVGGILELPKPLLGPFQRLRFAGMVEAELSDAEIIMRAR